jgi:A/G-specific adenine glycosylase
VDNPPVFVAIEMSRLQFADSLLDWYGANARRLPWRSRPGEPTGDVYRIWLSEIMLQQTTVAAVGPYFTRFTEQWPDVTALASADLADVMTAWAGLGYYARARNLHACARLVVAEHDGVFPASEAGLRTLPGIGHYTAAAIAAIAHDEVCAVVDANVERIIARFGAIRTPLPAARNAIRSIVSDFVPDKRAGDFAQAMMDLGATICTPRKPNCSDCPIREGCSGFAAGKPEHFPIKPPKKPKPIRYGTTFWLECDDRALLIRRPSSGLLGGMRALPSGNWNESGPDLANAPLDCAWRPCGTVSHTFTHFSLELNVVAASVLTSDVAAGEWWSIAAIEDAGLPTLFAKAATLAKAQRETR